MPDKSHPLTSLYILYSSPLLHMWFAELFCSVDLPFLLLSDVFKTFTKSTNLLAVLSGTSVETTGKLIRKTFPSMCYALRMLPKGTLHTCLKTNNEIRDTQIVSSIPKGNLYRQQATYTPKEAAKLDVDFFLGGGDLYIYIHKILTVTFFSCDLFGLGIMVKLFSKNKLRSICFMEKLKCW